MFHDLLRLPVTSRDVLVPVDVLAVLLTAWVVTAPVLRRTRAHPVRAVLIRLAALLVGAGAGLVAVWWTGDVQDLFGVAFTPVTRMWIAFAFAAVALLLVVLVQGGWTLRVVAVGAAAAVALSAGLGVNVDFGFYKDLEQAVATNPYATRSLAVQQHGAHDGAVIDAARWRAPARMPREGETLSVRIPGTVSHFRARKAVVWLPPAARVAHPPTLPVLVALSGQPGQPADMFQTGDLGRYLERYADAHHGLAPIVVSPDQLGAPERNPMCVDSRRLGRSATYVMTDTVRWIREHLPVATAPSAWGIVGFSQGATCAMQFSTAHPDVFGSALAISSEAGPRNGTVQNTIALGFGGSAAAYRAASPSAIMTAHGRYGDHLTVFGFGQDDAPYRASTDALRAVAERVGMQAPLVVSPGSAHDWNTVRYVLAHGLPTVIAHLGLPATTGAL
ncbi:MULTISPECIES: esterase family protein [unclassified Curtobacterium]|uniref:alpha/beta hydrolase n=1 Tax=unclassified Curtobacterium TaxID=257496 RepID=UPI000F9C1A75|nr:MULTISPECIES: alpha/beta hydrolase-fold protein [unclassified Curtobacterium]ROQ07086.1 S-formylglutathione hydrolase FrmB [Curtobacterium sp. PhB171]ROQ28012.1 S-formylglutathione hydrolase FrmB [Curtobacterium sp. PhB170]ROS34942.1 S-formylglutathione hydrolase FrmB [Curtobacterium sp. PhB131]ROS72691.1 S-formylglutathione hydrolase FrmB [Curtobacterium sp. PhB141]